jgi:tape measure domain-containing protein
MAKTDLETLVVRMEAQMKAFENELKRGRQTADRETRAIEKRFADTNKKIATSFNGLGPALTRGLGFLGIGFGAKELVSFADQFTRVQNALKVTGLEGEALTRVYDQLFASAQRNAAPLEALATLYNRAAISQKELRVSSADLLNFTDKVSVALRVSGQSAEASRGALIQLSQAIGAGVVRAEEFNSILEGALPIAQAAAAGIDEAGGSVAKLRKLIIDSKVSSEAFFKGFIAGSDLLVERSSKMDLTIGQAMTQVQNAFINAVGEIDKVTGTTDSATRAMRDLAEALRWISDNVSSLKGPYQEIAEAIRGMKVEAEGAYGWLQRIASLNVPANIGGYVGRKIGGALGLGGTPQFRGVTDADLDLGGGAGGATTKPIKLADFPVNGTDSGAASKDAFQRALEQAQKRITVQNAETAAINQGTAARERARLVAELETAAKQANAAAGLENTEVTAAQREKINALADAMYRSAQAAEAANSPLAQYAREAANVGEQLQEAAVSGLKSFEDALLSIGDKTKSVADQFREMAASIIRDLARIAIRSQITGPIAAALGGMFAPGAGGFAGFFAGGGTLGAGKWGIAGERGPEVIHGPAQITPIGKMAGAAGGITINMPVNLSAPGADPAQLGRLTVQVQELQRTLPQQVSSMIHRQQTRGGRA